MLLAFAPYHVMMPSSPAATSTFAVTGKVPAIVAQGRLCPLKLANEAFNPAELMEGS